MELKTFTFEFTLFGVKQKGKIKGKDYADARKNLDLAIVKKVQINEFSEFKPTAFTKAFDEFGKIFDGIFGKS